MNGKRSPIFISPLVNGKGVEERDWIPVQDGTHNDSTVSWAPGGDLFYFISPRDGSNCWWAQEVDPATNRPVGEAHALLHLHNPSQSLLAAASTGPAVVAGRFVFSMASTTGNIWLAEPAKKD